MRRFLWIPILAVAVVLGGIAMNLNQNLERSRTDYTKLQSDEAATRERYGNAISEIAAIQDSLDAIVLGDDGTRELQQQLDAERSLSKERTDETMDRIATIRAGVERAKTRIVDLESRLKESDGKIAGLDKLVKNLRASVAEKEQVIAQLTTRVDELQTQVAGLTTKVQEGEQLIEAQAVTIESQTAAIEDRRRELGTVLYTIGTKSELKDAGLVVSKGGVLGIGRTLKLSGEFPAGHFTPLDTDKEQVIHIAAEEARLLSDQPVSSYALVQVGEEVELHILDPLAFRTVKHVVIMTS
jgi:chromosome segregation ATPase